MTSKIQNVGEASKKCRSFRICLNLNDYQYKTSRYSCKSRCMGAMVTATQKSTIDTQNLKRKEHKHTTKENHQTTREGTKRKRYEQRTTKKEKKTSDKMSISTYLLIITLNVTGLNASVKRHRVGLD